MLKFCNLYSGSSGNCSFIKTSHVNILVDFGLTYKKIAEGLNAIGEDISNIDAILITHEHSDHIKGLKVLLNNYDIPIYSNKKTYEALKHYTKIPTSKLFITDDRFEIGDLDITPFSISHDAADPVAYNFQNKSKKVTICTDIGFVDNKIMKKLEGSDLLLLESNYEPDLLKCSNYPYSLKTRILGPKGHLSNGECAKVVSELATSGVNNVLLRTSK